MPRLLIVILSLCSSLALAKSASPAGLLGLDYVDYHVTPMVHFELREGVSYETTPRKACVMYLEGLGDSILNHRALFAALNQNGYRVITFDYMGQGGSQGSMNLTTLDDPTIPGGQITRQAKFFWSRYSECQSSPKFVVGWSTGGLAAYRLAHEGWADAVVLLAPGIAPRNFVGESARSHKLFLLGKPIITERTLTNNHFHNEADPHVEPPNPDTPAKALFFAANLKLTSILSHFWKIPSHVHGLVLLSGDSDTYVDAQSTMRVLQKNVPPPQFLVHQYQGALHELDNEIPSVAQDVRSRTVKFFNQNMSKL